MNMNVPYACNPSASGGALTSSQRQTQRSQNCLGSSTMEGARTTRNRRPRHRNGGSSVTTTNDETDEEKYLRIDAEVIAAFKRAGYGGKEAKPVTCHSSKVIAAYLGFVSVCVFWGFRFSRSDRTID